MKDAFIIDGIRTPIGNFRGALSGIRTDDLAALVMRKLVERNPSIPDGVIDDVIFGCANQAGEDNRNVSRMALLLAGVASRRVIPGDRAVREGRWGALAMLQDGVFELGALHPMVLHSFGCNCSLFQIDRLLQRQTARGASYQERVMPG